MVTGHIKGTDAADAVGTTTGGCNRITRTIAKTRTALVRRPLVGIIIGCPAAGAAPFVFGSKARKEVTGDASGTCGADGAVYGCIAAGGPRLMPRGAHRSGGSDTLCDPGRSKTTAGRMFGDAIHMELITAGGETGFGGADSVRAECSRSE